MSENGKNSKNGSSDNDKSIEPKTKKQIKKKSKKAKVAKLSTPTTQELKKQIEELEVANTNREDFKFLESITRHIKLVREAAWLLSTRIWERNGEGDKEFAKRLMVNVGQHDNTKFFGIEWTDLRQNNPDKDKLKLSHVQHLSSNQHHPENWGGLNSMPDLMIAEMVCDWKARSDEKGSDLRDWIKNSAVEKYSISTQGKSYKKIKEYVDLLLDPPFGKI